MTSSFLYGIFRANERDCSDTDHFCSDSDRFCSDSDRFGSFDNWLRDPISENEQLMLNRVYLMCTTQRGLQLLVFINLILESLES